MDYNRLANIYKAMGDDTRLKILKMLSEGELCACKILEEFSFTQPTLSYHMKYLCDAGIVICVKEGKWNHYSINYELLDLMHTYCDSLRVKE